MSDPGQFGWHDMMSADLETSQAFYTGLFGWEMSADVRPDGYRRLSAGEVEFGGIRPWPPEVPGMSMWTGYVTTDDLASTVTRARSLGGQVPVESMEIPGIGLLGVIVDPTGADQTLFQYTGSMGMDNVGPAGAGGIVLWNELITTDARAAAEFYAALHGWRVDPKIVEARGYVIARTGDVPVAGIFQTPVPPARSAWITYFGVSDIDTTIERAQVLGAETIHPATDVPNVGRTAWLRDPAQAIFGLMEPLENWMERI